MKPEEYCFHTDFSVLLTVLLPIIYEIVSITKNGLHKRRCKRRNVENG